jgi:hypothetical protein
MSAYSLVIGFSAESIGYIFKNTLVQILELKSTMRAKRPTVAFRLTQLSNIHLSGIQKEPKSIIW